jgi:hypothetical protein
MALITKSSNCGWDGNMLQKGIVISGLIAGEDLGKCDPVYIKSDGLAYKTITSASANGKACYAGFAFSAAKTGEVCDIVRNVAGSFASGMTPGALLFVSGSAAVLSDAAVISGDDPVAMVITASEILAL